MKFEYEIVCFKLDKNYNKMPIEINKTSVKIKDIHDLAIEYLEGAEYQLKEIFNEKYDIVKNSKISISLKKSTVTITVNIENLSKNAIKYFTSLFDAIDTDYIDCGDETFCCMAEEMFKIDDLDYSEIRF